MDERVTPFIFVGGSRATPLEALMADAHEAIARDTIERLLAVDLCATPVVATSSESFARTASDLPVEVVRDDEPFHFGRTLDGLIERFGARRPLYIGAGAAPLLQVSDLRAISQTLLATTDAVIANNFFSADFVGFTPGSAIHRIVPPSIDNDLAFLLQRQAGLRNLPLARNAGTQMDVDTPTDLAILSLHPGAGPCFRQFLSRAALDTSRLVTASKYLTDPTAEVIVAGRVGSQVWNHLETDLACRKRIFSEERGMRASGREARGEVRSLLGHHLSAVGPMQFFADLSELGQALFLDSRVIFHHLRLDLSATDRFASDLLDVNAIENPTVRAFTAAARDATIPIVLGGHSLVAGGLWALIEAAWIERDRQIATQPS